MKKIPGVTILPFFFFCSCALTSRDNFVNNRVGYISFNTRTRTIEAHSRVRIMNDTRVERVRIFYDTNTSWRRAYDHDLESQPLLKDFRFVIPEEVISSLKPGMPFNIQVDPTTYDVLYVLRFTSTEILKHDTILKFTFNDYSRNRH